MLRAVSTGTWQVANMLMLIIIISQIKAKLKKKNQHIHPLGHAKHSWLALVVTYGSS